MQVVVDKQKPLKKRAEYRQIALKTCDSDNLMSYKSKRAIGAFKRVLCDFGFFKFLSQGIYFFVSMNAGAARDRFAFVNEKIFNVTITRSNVCL